MMGRVALALNGIAFLIFLKSFKEIGKGVLAMNQLTFSLQGGVVREPVYDHHFDSFKDFKRLPNPNGSNASGSSSLS